MSSQDFKQRKQVEIAHLLVKAGKLHRKAVSGKNLTLLITAMGLIETAKAIDVMSERTFLQHEKYPVEVNYFI